MTTNEYNQCVEAHADGVYRFVLKHIRDEDAAKDIVQDSFEKMWLKKDDVDAAKGKSYLFTTAYHTLIDHTRKNKRIERLEDKVANIPHHNTQYSDAAQVINEAVNKLPEVQKAVVMLRDYEGYSYEEIAAITKLTESQVKVYIYRARVFLREYLVSVEAVI